jgi:hypothetical protein
VRSCILSLIQSPFQWFDSIVRLFNSSLKAGEVVRSGRVYGSERGSVNRRWADVDESASHRESIEHPLLFGSRLKLEFEDFALNHAVPYATGIDV